MRAMEIGVIRVDLRGAEVSEVEARLHESYGAWLERTGDGGYALGFDDGPFTVALRGGGQWAEIAVQRVPQPQLARPWSLALSLSDRWGGKIEVYDREGRSVLGPCAAPLARQARYDWPYLWRKEDVRRAVADTFAPAEQAEALAALARYRGGAAERIQLAIVKAAGGNLEELRRLVVAARTDYRDVLTRAGL
jgi:hypothetical protein